MANINSQNYRSALHPVKIDVGWLCVTGEVHRQDILQPFLKQLHDDEIHHGYYQQDEATTQTLHETMEFIRDNYNDVISRNI